MWYTTDQYLPKKGQVFWLMVVDISQKETRGSLANMQQHLYQDACCIHRDKKELHVIIIDNLSCKFGNCGYNSGRESEREKNKEQILKRNHGGHLFFGNQPRNLEKQAL